jgi:hypothetical protein
MDEDRRVDEMEEALRRCGVLPDTTVYRLCIADVICVLADKGYLKFLTAKQVAELSDYVGDKLEIPFHEYILACIETHDKFEEWTSQSPKD